MSRESRLKEPCRNRDAEAGGSVCRSKVIARRTGRAGAKAVKTAASATMRTAISVMHSWRTHVCVQRRHCCRRSDARTELIRLIQ